MVRVGVLVLLVALVSAAACRDKPATGTGAGPGASGVASTTAVPAAAIPSAAGCGAAGSFCARGLSCVEGDCTKIGWDAEQREACAIVTKQTTHPFARAADLLCGRGSAPPCAGKSESECGKGPLCQGRYGSANPGLGTPDVGYTGCDAASPRALAKLVRWQAQCEEHGGRWTAIPSERMVPRRGTCECLLGSANPWLFVPERSCVSERVLCEEERGTWDSTHARCVLDGGDLHALYNLRF